MTPAVGGTRRVPVPDAVARDYLLLALRLDQHVPGLVDGFFGPADLKAQVDLEPVRSPAALAGDARRCAIGWAARVDDDARRELAGAAGGRPRDPGGCARRRRTPVRWSTSSAASPGARSGGRTRCSRPRLRELERAAAGPRAARRAPRRRRCRVDGPGRRCTDGRRHCSCARFRDAQRRDCSGCPRARRCGCRSSAISRGPATTGTTAAAGHGWT